ncbi:MAG TPA: hypothetical protein VJP02_16585 [Candidatus Sulfotelmatobacter sp.]|nr:hypothetical protein [Candidatus Sulfotelmatobacter sp.]
MTPSLEVKYNQLLDENATLTRIIDACKGEIASLKLTVHQERVAHAATKRADILSEAMLPAESIARLNRAFAQSTDNAGLPQAINCEHRHVRSTNKQDLRTERILG